MDQAKHTFEDHSRRTGGQRRFRRIPISLAGRYMLSDKREFACRTIDVSSAGMAISGPIPPMLGERVVVYLDHLGRIEGTAVRTLFDGFAMSFQWSPPKRQRLTDQLTWLLNRNQIGGSDNRTSNRVVPKNPHTAVTLEGGVKYPAYIIDMSRSGAAVRCEAQPEVDSRVTLGGSRAHVVRLFETGLALQFVRLIPIEQFDEDYAP